MGQRGITRSSILSAISNRLNDTNESIFGYVPAVAGAYGPNYMVRHIAKSIREINPGNIVSSALSAEIPTVLVGKVSDICSLSETGLINIPAITTRETAEALQVAINGDSRLIIANFQQVDLMGHARNVAQAAFELHAICAAIDALVKQLSDGDLLLVVADHGNDPNAPGNSHTTERVPLLVLSPPNAHVPNLNVDDLGVVRTLVAAHLNLRLE